MRTIHNYKNKQKVHLHPVVLDGLCPICGLPLKKLYHTGKKRIRTLERVLVVYYWIYCCSNPQCTAYNKLLRHPPINLKHKEFGNDLYALVGILRYTKKMTFAQIRAELINRGVEIGQHDSSVKNIAETYLQLITSKPLANIPSHQLEKMQEEGIVLAVDGVQPEKGNEVLYLLSDVRTGELLYARELDSSDTESLLNILKIIDSFSFPIQGLISDKQPSLVKALRTLWPEAPYQYCQLHFFQNLAKPVNNEDSALKKN